MIQNFPTGGGDVRVGGCSGGGDVRVGGMFQDPPRLPP